MLLYLLRHGKAAERTERQPDAERRLTPEGIQEMHEVAAGIHALSLQPDVIASSPLPRALETAQIVAAALEYPQDAIQIDPRLASGEFGLGALQDLLDDLEVSHSLMVAGHEPDLSETVRRLCGAVVEMKKGGLACVEFTRPEPMSGILRWLLTPRQLRGLGE